MSTDVPPLPERPDDIPPSRSTGNQGVVGSADAGLYLIGVIAVLAFISMIAVLFWVASREKAAPVVAVASPTATETEAAEVLLPLVSGGSVTETPQIAAGGQGEATATPIPTEQMAEPTSTEVSAGGGAPQTTSTSTIQPNPPTQPGVRASSTPASTQGATSTATPTIQVSGPTPTVQLSSLIIRNDKGCVDPRNYDLYLFGEIVNNNPVAVDIQNWDLRVFDNGTELSVDQVFLDLPNNYAVFANSSIPFALYASLNRPTFTSYDIVLDFAPGIHTPRTDLRIDEFNVTRDAGFTKVAGKWSHTDTANPPRIVWIIAAEYDTQGRVSNLQYTYYTNASVVDLRLPPGQHMFDNIYLEDNPCSGGTIVVSIAGE